MDRPRRFRPRLDHGELRVLVTVGLSISTVESIRPTASYRALEFGAGAGEIGIIAGAYATLALFAAVPLGRAVDRFGERWFLTAGSSLLIVGAVIGLAIPRLWALVLMQATVGLGHISVAVSAQTLSGNTENSRELRFARLSVATAAGHLVGPLVAGTIIDGERSFPVVQGTGGALTVAAAFGAIAVCLAATSRSTPGVGPVGTTEARSKVGIRSLLTISGMPQAVYVGIAALTTMDLLVAYLPAVGEERGIRPSVIGYLLATRAVMTIASRLVMGYLLDRLGRRRLLLAALVVAAATVVSLAVPLPVWSLFLVMSVAGFALGVLFPLTSAWVANRAPARARGTALAIRLTGNRLSQVIVPVGLGALAATFGVGVIFIAAGAGLFAGSAMVQRAPLGQDGAD